eukprot:12074684-Karenia_brevis.AAC.1
MAYVEPEILSSPGVGLQDVHGGAVDASVFHKFYFSHPWYQELAEDPASGGDPNFFGRKFSPGARITHEDI